jgi:hypothetical protein
MENLNTKFLITDETAPINLAAIVVLGEKGLLKRDEQLRYYEWRDRRRYENVNQPRGR